LHQILLKNHRGPSFLATVWFGSSPAPFPPLSRQQVVSFSFFMCRPSSLLTGEAKMERGWASTKSYFREKAWSSIYNSILSGLFSVTQAHLLPHAPPPQLLPASIRWCTLILWDSFSVDQLPHLSL
jgi:hypothetical protein